ncbi:MAG: hypothetical protein CMN32_11685 [Saprospirales bacterium]|nr:hypothetical protein [Saprospirales bacterium]
MKKSLFLFFVTTAFLISCTKEPHQNFTKINDLDLVEVFQSKSNLLNLSPRNRKIAWIARLNEYKNLDLKPSQVILIDELIKEIESMDTEVFMATPKLTELAIEMAKITPMEDYLNLFCSTGDYLPEITGIGSVCEQCINDLRNVDFQSFDPSNEVKSRTSDCNCAWTCQQQEDNMLCEPGYYATTLPPCDDDQTSGCCNQTASGCGFLFLYSCTGLVVCEPL